MNSRHSTAFVCVLTFTLSSSLARAQDRPRLEQVVDSFAASGFMGAVLVAKGDTVLLNRGWGSANLEWDIPVTPRTRFRIASATEQFTAAAILLLEERGKLSIDDPIHRYLTDIPATWDKIFSRRRHQWIHECAGLLPRESCHDCGVVERSRLG